MQQPDFKIKAKGTMTPPPPECGGEDCRYVDGVLIHACDREDN